MKTICIDSKEFKTFQINPSIFNNGFDSVRFFFWSNNLPYKKRQEKNRNHLEIFDRKKTSDQKKNQKQILFLHSIRYHCNLHRLISISISMIETKNKTIIFRTALDSMLQIDFHRERKKIKIKIFESIVCVEKRTTWSKRIQNHKEEQYRRSTMVCSIKARAFNVHKHRRSPLNDDVVDNSDWCSFLLIPFTYRVTSHWLCFVSVYAGSDPI